MLQWRHLLLQRGGNYRWEKARRNCCCWYMHVLTGHIDLLQSVTNLFLWLPFHDKQKEQLMIRAEAGLFLPFFCVIAVGFWILRGLSQLFPSEHHKWRVVNRSSCYVVFTTNAMCDLWMWVMMYVCS